MESLLYGVAVLACPVGMGAMMWSMARGGGAAPQRDSELQRLRAEVAQLRAEQQVVREG